MPTDLPPSSPFPAAVDRLFTRCRLATMANGRYGIMEDAALAVTGNHIAWIGPMTQVPAFIQKSAPSSAKRGTPRDTRAENSLASATGPTACRQIIDCRNRWILPGFVDCHTHLIWAGSRAREFEMRLAGNSYEAIARAGGGIVSTVKATREADEDQLFTIAARRMAHFLTQGITCVEIKSGYGLNPDTELKMLSVAGRLDTAFPQHVAATFLGAHALPPEFADRPDAYIHTVIHQMLPRIKAQGIATAVDGFCETIAFSVDQVRQVFDAARDSGFSIKLHAEQLSDSHGAAMAAEMGAVSCDHLEYLSRDGAEQMAANGTVAVLLPGAFQYLKETRPPPVDLLRGMEIPMAVSTDLNPGSSPVYSMSPILNLSCLLFGLTCEEALAGATLHAARALGLSDRKGSLETGKDADFVIWDLDTPADLCYQTGMTPVTQVIIGGKTVYQHRGTT